MNTVEPIRDKRKLEAIKKVLLGGGQYRDYLLFVLGINSGLRVSDLLALRWEDLMDEDGVKPRLHIKERKTGKVRLFSINKASKEALTYYLGVTGLTPSPQEFVFASREGAGPISRVRAYQMLNEVAEQVGLKEKIGTHTLRKTFGYHAHRQGASIEVLQKVFGHSAPSITMRYLGITQDTIDEVVDNLNL